ncbi:MAG: hypothetical protein AB1755_03715 [Candidatus Omnitrophota bacterium]
MYLDKDLECEIRDIAQNLFSQNNIKIFDFKIFREANNLVLRFLVDKPEGGILIDECSSLNKQLVRLIDESKILEDGFTLEVASPGLDRALKTHDDFLRVINKNIVCFLSLPLEGKTEVRGELINVTDDSIIVMNTKEYEIKLTAIAKAKQIINIGR